MFFVSALILLTNALTECLGKVLANDEYHPAKACPNGIEHGIIEDGFPVWPHRVHLFQTAVTAAHSGCEDE